MSHPLLRALQPPLRTEHVRVVAEDGRIGLQDVERDGDEGALGYDELAVLGVGQRGGEGDGDGFCCL